MSLNECLTYRIGDRGHERIGDRGHEGIGHRLLQIIAMQSHRCNIASGQWYVSGVLKTRLMQKLQCDIKFILFN